MVKLLRISMKQFTRGVYTPDGKTKQVVNLGEYAQEFVLVSFEADGFSNPRLVKAYGRGFDCWWIRQEAV